MISQRLAAHKPPQLPRLHFEHPAIRHLIAELRGAHLRVEPAEPRFPKRLSSPVIQESAVGIAQAEIDLARAHEGDPNLRSLAAVTGYNVHASDGGIGHVADFLVDDASWGIRYLIIDTRNWWPGAHVLLSPYAIQEISWSRHEVRLDVSRERVRSSPPWNPLEALDEAYEKRLHGHYDWPGYGW